MRRVERRRQMGRGWRERERQAEEVMETIREREKEAVDQEMKLY
jgi:hypothetical protein